MMAPPFDPETIRRVKRAAPLLEIVGRHVVLSPDGEVRQGRCARPAGHAACAFRLDLRAREWSCAACGGHGDILDFVMRYDRVPFARAVEAVAAAGGVVLPRLPGGPERPRGSLL